MNRTLELKEHGTDCGMQVRIDKYGRMSKLCSKEQVSLHCLRGKMLPNNVNLNINNRLSKDINNKQKTKSIFCYTLLAKVLT